MKTIIAGSRHLDWRDTREAIKECPWVITEVVSGCCGGPDEHGEHYAKLGKLPAKHFPACWALHGKAAGFIRNQRMANYADALVAVWDGESRGTKDMICRAREAGLRVFVFRPCRDS